MIASVPELGSLARLTGEQLCNIDSKDMQEAIWLRPATAISADGSMNLWNLMELVHL